MGLFLAAAFVLIPAQVNVTEHTAFFEEVSLSISSARSTYYVAEPVHLKARMRNAGSTRVRGFLGVWPYVNTTSILYRKDDGAFRQFSLAPEDIDVDVRAQALDPGQESRKTVVLACDETCSTPLLDEVGVYEFKLIYWGSRIRGRPIESNVVSVRVATPPSEHSDSAASFMEGGLFRLAQHDGLLPAVPDALVPVAERFLNEYPESPYTSDVWWGLFLFLEHHAFSPAATESEKRLYERLCASEELKSPRFEEDDTTAPTLALSVAPSTLWPPNHKLVPVAATVNVSDDQDPSPVVKLVSITCDDGCDPTADVAGADLSTDDRDFQVRAERTGPGEGRTYTITYSATDASGNEAQAVATVVVPHDRGKK